MADSLAVEYDDVLYGDLAFFHTHPSHLASVAALCGLPVPPVENARVLEIGCGTGFNLLAMSRSLPEAHLVGIDLSEKQIQYGRTIAAAIGADRVDLRFGRLEELDASIGEFDYIVAHGVYSWVPPDVQVALLNLIRDRLAPHGIGYVSYNTLPGWNFRGIVRDAMRFLVPDTVAPFERVTAAREAVRTMLDALPENDSTYAKVLQEEIASSSTEADYYMLHEYFAEYNRPVLFADFAKSLADAGLQFLSESRFGTSSFAQLGEDRKALDPAGDDLIRREQYHDFRWQRYFRQSLVVHASRTVSRSPDPHAIAKLWLNPRVELVEPIGDLDETDSDAARREEDGEIVQINDPLYRRLLRRLSATPGRTLQLAAFRPDVIELVGIDIGDANVLQLLTRVVVKGTIEEVWHLYAAEPRFATECGDRPRACPLVRRQARTSLAVTNRLHRTSKLSAVERDVLLRLDGQTTRDELARSLGLERSELDRHLARLAALAVLEA